MSEKIQVSTSRMKRDAQKLEEQIAVLPDVIKELRTQMRLLSSCWEGPAWMAFQNQMADDISYMSEVYQFLSSYSKSLDGSAEDYLKAEQQNYSEIRRLWV